jgi:NDP-sugar pyrophosphorylase family protein
MKAVILVGGLGTRVRPLTFSIPKPLLPVGERPILALILERLRNSGVRDAILATGYQAELIRAYCGDGSKFDLELSYVHEDEPLGTAGPLALVCPHVNDDEDIILMNGDILTDFNVTELVRFRRERGYDLVVGYTRHLYQSPFGVLALSGEDVQGIVEKPTVEQPVSAGIYALGGHVCRHVPERVHFTMPQLIEEVLADGGSVGALEISDVWIGLESIVQFEEALRYLETAPPASEFSGTT